MDSSTDSLTSLQRHMANVGSLSVRKIVALSKARTIGLTEVFNIVSDTEASADDWLPVWNEAHQMVETVALDHGLEGLPEVVSAASDVAASAAVAKHLGSTLTADMNMALAGPWRDVKYGR